MSNRNGRAPHQFVIPRGRWRGTHDTFTAYIEDNGIVGPPPEPAGDDDRRSRSITHVLMLLVVSVFCLAGCTDNGFVHGMEGQPKVKPMSESDFFADGRGARPVPAGTVARGELRDDELLYTGKLEGRYATELPFPATRGVLERGQERFNIYCAVCHDRLGNGDGMVVRRGFSRPPSFHTDRLRQAPVGHFYDVITNGFGAMYSYADRVPVRDRWAIVAYIRALQLSQHATLAQAAPEARRKLEAEQ